MGRMEKFKQKRNLRKKYVSAALLFFFMSTAGIFSVDYTTNYLMTGRQCISFVTMNSRETYLEIVLMNQRLYVNTQYINRDLNRLKTEIKRFFNK